MNMSTIGITIHADDMTDSDALMVIDAIKEALTDYPEADIAYSIEEG